MEWKSIQKGDAYHKSKSKTKQMKIIMKREILEQAKEFKYLGCIITDDAKCHDETKRRISTDKQAFTADKSSKNG